MGWLKDLLSGDRVAQEKGPTPRAPVPRAEHVPLPPRLVVAPSWALTSPALRPDGHSRVAGESYRQDALRRHLHAARPHRYVVAQLVRDPKNPHDRGAVAVFVGADHVGFVPRADLDDMGPSLSDALSRLARRRVPATCWARLNGGTADKPSIGITLLLWT